MSTYAPPLPRTGGPAGLAQRARGLVRSRPGDPWWVRPGFLAVLALAAALCLWDLTISGWSNDYYAAAARAGSESWKAWFFGAIDPGSFITVDKPPLSLWLSGLSARVLGFSSFSILLPQALCTIAAVGLLFSAVRRAFGPSAGLIAAATLAITPVTVAIARVNNPDALLVLLLVASAALMMRALESGRTKHLVWCGAIVGLAFMTKMLQGWMVVPALAGAYLVAGPPALWTRVRQLALAGVAMVAVSAAWPVAVSLWPGSAPYIGGSTNGSVWNLIFGYNGFGRLTGSEGGPGGGGGPGFGGTAGLWRMFNEQVGGQVAWLLPLAAAGLVVGLWRTRRAPRTDLARGAWILFGLWAVVHVAVFSAQKGIFHPYYVSALAPAVAALAGAGVVTMWRWARESWAGVLALDGAVVGSACLAVSLLDRTPDFAPALRVIILLLALGTVGASLFARAPGAVGRRGVAVAAVAGALAVGLAPAAYSVASVGRALNGNNVLAGPASAARGSMGGPGGMAGGPGGPGGGSLPSRGMPGAGTGTPPAGGPPAGLSAGAGGAAGAGGGPGGGGSVSNSLISYLESHQGSARYLVAVSGSQSSAPIIIRTGRAVVTIGGFNGGDPAPTVSQLAQMVKRGELRYVLLSGNGGGPGGRGGSQAISTWVQSHGTAVSGVSSGGGTLYRVSA